MKKILTLLIAVIATSSVFAQEKEQSGDLNFESISRIQTTKGQDTVKSHDAFAFASAIGKFYAGYPFDSMLETRTLVTLFYKKENVKISLKKKKYYQYLYYCVKVSLYRLSQTQRTRAFLPEEQNEGQQLLSGAH